MIIAWLWKSERCGGLYPDLMLEIVDIGSSFQSSLKFHGMILLTASVTCSNVWFLASTYLHMVISQTVLRTSTYNQGNFIPLLF